MTAQTKPYPAVTALIDTFADWLEHRRELSEIRQLDTAEFDRIAGDLRVSPADLNELVRRGRTPQTSCRSCLRPSVSTKKRWCARSRWCCATWSASAPCASTRRECDRDLAAGTSA